MSLPLTAVTAVAAVTKHFLLISSNILRPETTFYHFPPSVLIPSQNDPSRVSQICHKTTRLIMPPADRSHHLSHVLTKPCHFEEPQNLCSCQGEKTMVATVTASTTLTSIKIWFLWWLCGRSSQVLQGIITTPSTPPLCLVLAMPKMVCFVRDRLTKKKQGPFRHIGWIKGMRP